MAYRILAGSVVQMDVCRGYVFLTHLPMFNKSCGIYSSREALDCCQRFISNAAEEAVTFALLTYPCSARD
jgi:hypothetical protein